MTKRKQDTDSNTEQNAQNQQDHPVVAPAVQWPDAQAKGSDQVNENAVPVEEDQDANSDDNDSDDSDSEDHR